MLTRQELFDKVWRGLKAQGFEQSTNAALCGYGGCAYRGSDGRRCSAGHAIDDEHYSPAFEGEGISRDENGSNCVGAVGALVASGVNPIDFVLISDLQYAHDETLSPAEMESAVREVASFYGLTIPDEAA